MGTRINGKDDVAAIKLSTGNQIERRGKHSHPRSHCGGMQIELAGIHVRCRSLATECGKNHLSQFENQRKAKQLGIGCLRGEWLTQEQGKKEYRQGYNKSRNGTGNSDIKQAPPVANWRANADERSQGPNQSWRRNKKRPSGKYLSPQTQNIVAHLVRCKNSEQTK